MIKGCLTTILLGFALLLGVIIFGGSPSKTPDYGYPEGSTRSTEIRQRGFFKDDRGNRLYTLEIPAGTGASTVQSHASNLTYRAGQAMSAYYYPSGSRLPVDGVTLAKNYFAALAATDTPGLSRYSFVFIRNLNGTTSFADCTVNPRDALCAPQ